MLESLTCNLARNPVLVHLSGDVLEESQEKVGPLICVVPSGRRSAFQPLSGSMDRGRGPLKFGELTTEPKPNLNFKKLFSRDNQLEHT